MLQLLARPAVIAQGEIGARHIHARSGGIRIDGQNPLESQRGLVGLAAIQRGDAQQVIEIDVPGAFEFEFFEQAVRFPGFAPLHQVARLRHFIPCRQASRTETRQHQKNRQQLQSAMNPHKPLPKS